MSDITVAISTIADGTMLVRDDPTNSQVLANRERYLAKFGITMEQTTRFKVTYDRENFCQYHEVGPDMKGAGMRDGETVTGDGIVTTDVGHALMLPIADCIGCVFYDPTNRVLMLSHLGRHSLEQQGAQKSVEYLTEHHNSKPQELKVWLTPSASKELYPIWKLDNMSLKEAFFAQATSAGILPENITDNPTNTDIGEGYYSHSEFLKGHREEDGDHMIVAMMN